VRVVSQVVHDACVFNQPLIDGGFMSVLTLAWDVSLFRKSQEKTTASECYAAVQSILFWTQTMFVCDFVRIVHAVRVWGSSCNCHEEQRARGEPVDCEWAGRRLAEAWARLECFFEDCVPRLTAPADDDFSSVADLRKHGLFEEWVWAWRYLKSVASELTAWVNRLPVKLARVVTVAHLKEAREEFRASDPKKQHRVACKFFAADGLLSADVDESITSGVMKPVVAEHLDAITKSVLAENRGEGPHAGLARESRRAPAAKRIWHASTQRLATNIRGSLQS
jgi:hypothetical protein